MPSGMGTKSPIALLAVAALLVAIAGKGGGGRSVRASGTQPASEIAPHGRAGAAKPAADSAAPDAKATRPEDAADPPGAVTGRIVAGSLPLAGVRVVLRRGGWSQVVETLADGSFALAGCGSAMLSASLAGFAPCFRAMDLAPGESAELTLELERGETVEVVVLDGPTRRPLADARIVVLRTGQEDALLSGANEVWSEVASTRELFRAMPRTEADRILKAAGTVRFDVVTTDGAGRARIVDLAPGSLDALVLQPDYPPGRISAAPIPASDPPIVLLYPGGSLLVLAPPREIDAGLQRVCEVAAYGHLEAVVAEVLFDRDGRALVAPLLPGTYKVREFVRPALDFGGDVSIDPTSTGLAVVRAGETTTVDLGAVRPARILALLADLPPGGMGEPVAAALFGGDGFGDQLGVVVDSPRLSFEWDAVNPGRYRIVAQSDEGWSARADFTIEPGRDRVDVILRPGPGGIEGSVAGPGGLAFEARIVVEQAASAGRFHNLADRAREFPGSLGMFSGDPYALVGLPAGEYRALCAVGDVIDSREFALRDGQRLRLDFVCDGSRQDSVTIRLRDAGGGPIEGRMRVAPVPGGAALMEAISGGLSRMLQGGERQLALPRGTYRVTAGASGYALVRRLPFTVDGPRTLDLTLVRGHLVRLRLLDGEAPLRNADFDLLDERGNSLTETLDLFFPRTFRTDGEGRAVLEDVAPGEYTVRREGRAAGSIRVGDSPAEITIR